jgi:RecJ-like exonuclease
MIPLFKLAEKAAEKIKKCNSVIQIVSHYDADGIAAASIVALALNQINKAFQITIIKKLDEGIIRELKEREPEIVIFTDMGSGYLDLIKELKCVIIIADHHEIVYQWDSDKLIHINSELFGIPGISGSGTAYILAKGILHIEEGDAKSLATLAVVGTMGDSASSNFEMFKESEYIKQEKGLKLFGRFSRPLHKSIGLADIPGINDESKAIQFLSEIGIKFRENGEWRTLSDLTQEEIKKLTDAIVLEYIKEEKPIFESSIVDNVFTLKDFPEELRDAKEFATLLNCCGKMGEPAIGIGLCFGAKKSLEKARNVYKNYKKLIASYLEWVEKNWDNTEVVRKTANANYIIAGDNIKESLVGVIASIIQREYNEKPIFGLANGEDSVKVSARTSGNIDLGKILHEAASLCGGRGGGHCETAGCNIPFENQEKFIELCDKLIAQDKALFLRNG